MPADPDAGRPQDQGRAHRRRPATSALGGDLLDLYLETLRGELRDVLGRLAPVADPQLGLDGKAAPPTRPALKDRASLVSLAVQLRNALGAEVDPMPRPGDAATTPAARPRRRRARLELE